MPNADSILLPPTPAELAVRFQKRMAEVEEVFPGLVEKTRDWMKCPKFAKMFVRAKKNIRAPRVIRMSIVPMSMKVQVARIAGLSNIVECGWDYSTNHYDLIEWVADMLWKEAGMPSKYWELGTYENLRP